MTLDLPQVVEVFEDDVKKRVVKCAGISIDRPKAYDIPTKVRVVWRSLAALRTVLTYFESPTQV